MNNFEKAAQLYQRAKHMTAKDSDLYFIITDHVEQAASEGELELTYPIYSDHWPKDLRTEVVKCLRSEGFSVIRKVSRWPTLSGLFVLPIEVLTISGWAQENKQ